MQGLPITVRPSLQLPVLHDIYFGTGDTGIHLLEYNEYGCSKKIK